MNKPATTTKYMLSLEARTRSTDSFRAVKLFDTLDEAAQYLKDHFDLTNGVATYHLADDRMTGHIESFRRLYLTIERTEVLE